MHLSSSWLLGVLWVVGLSTSEGKNRCVLQIPWATFRDEVETEYVISKGVVSIFWRIGKYNLSYTHLRGMGDAVVH